MLTGSKATGSLALEIDEKTRKKIRSIKEITVNHSDADIYAALKETKMDADEAVHKLIYQDTFHEVKRKKDKKKELTSQISVEPSNRGKPSETISREPNLPTHLAHNVRRRRDYNQNYIPRNEPVRNAVPKNPAAAGHSREFRVVRDNRSNMNADKELKHTSTKSFGLNIGEEAAIRNIQSSSGGLVGHQPYGNRYVPRRRSKQTGNVPTRKQLYDGRQTVHDVTVPSNNSVLGVYPSSADPVHVPSPHSRSSAVGAIRREVRGLGFARKASENVSKDSSALRKDVPKAYMPFSPISKIDHGRQANPQKPVVPNHISISNSQRGNRSYRYVRTQQQAGGHRKGVSQNKQWKPKSNQKYSGNKAGVIGDPKESCAPPTDNSVNMESEIVKLQDRLSHVNISGSQTVIFADQLRVTETDRCQLTFGSLVLDFDPSPNSASGFEEACSSQELKHSNIKDSLPTPLEDSTNGASGTKTVETFDSEVRNAGAGSSSPALMASEEQLSEEKVANQSPNLDEYPHIEFISINGLEPKQQQNPLELHNFSQALNPQMFINVPASTIPMLQQQQALMAQMYPQVHVSHFPNGMPCSQFLSPVYVPQMPMQGYSGNPAAYAHPSNGNNYVLMPGGSSHPGANGLEYGIQQHKQVPASGLIGAGTFNNMNGYQIRTLDVVGNAPGFEDSSLMKYKEGNVYVPKPQAETSEIWMQNSRDVSGLQAPPPYYNMAGQTPHAAYMSSFNSLPVQSSHMQFQGVFHSPQPGTMANLSGLRDNIGVGVAPSLSAVQFGAYQQPQLGHVNWPTNF